MDIAYNWENIEQFLHKVANNKNLLSQNRENIIEEYLSENKGHVGEFIKNNIKQSLLQYIKNRRIIRHHILFIIPLIV